jgi:predicted transcriptional regulator
MSPEKIRNMRKELGVTQCELARRSGVSRFKIGMFEKGYYLLKGDDQRAIHKALKSLSLEANHVL